MTDTPPTETIHELPAVDTGLMPCCGRTPFEAPLTDRIRSAESPEPATCAGLDPRARTEAAAQLVSLDEMLTGVAGDARRTELLACRAGCVEKLKDADQEPSRQFLALVIVGIEERLGDEPLSMPADRIGYSVAEFTDRFQSSQPWCDASDEVVEAGARVGDEAAQDESDLRSGEPYTGDQG